MGRFELAACRVPPRGFIAAVTAALFAALSGAASAQFGMPQQFELSPSIQIEDIDETDAKPQLAQLNAYIAGGKWDEAVEALRKLAEEHGERIVQLEDRRYVSIRDFCHLKIASLPPEALALYRARVDQVAADWYRQGLKERDERPLTSVAQKLLCSSFGDDALLALGDIALEQGNYDRARQCWQQISPLMRGADGQQAWQVLHSVRQPKEWDAALLQFQKKPDKPRWPAFPDTDIDLAAVRARLVLCSIMEGEADQARQELIWLDRLHPGAKGKLAGRDGPYRQTLEALLSASAQWPVPAADENWATFAKESTRNGTALHRPPQSGRPDWELSLATLTPAAEEKEKPFPLARWRPMRAVEIKPGLPYHPLIVGNQVLLCNQQRVFAFDAQTGRPASPRADTVPAQSTYPGVGSAQKALPPIFSDDRQFGEPRYTMTVSGNLALVRLGSQVTSRPAGGFEPALSRLVCIDYRDQSFRWSYPTFSDNNSESLAEEEFRKNRWAIEGSPVCDGQTAYVGLRRNTFRNEAHVAALDARTGRLLWQRRICAADSPGPNGMRNELTHNLLTLHGDTLYYNTNLGAVAALATRDGTIRWVYRYERAQGGEFEKLPQNFRRDLNPCIYHNGLVLAAPSDSYSVFALDAGTGLLTWDWRTLRNDSRDEQPLQLLGVGSGRLIAAGNSIWWLDVATGKGSRRASVWPDRTMNGETGFGRGLLAGGCIFWPTHEEIFVLDQNWDGQGSPILDRIQLTRPDTGDRVTGGNLAYANGTLLVAGPQRIFAFHSPLAAQRKGANVSKSEGGRE